MSTEKDSNRSPDHISDSQPNSLTNNNTTKHSTGTKTTGEPGSDKNIAQISSKQREQKVVERKEVKESDAENERNNNGLSNDVANVDIKDNNASDENPEVTEKEVEGNHERGQPTFESGSSTREQTSGSISGTISSSTVDSENGNMNVKHNRGKRSPNSGGSGRKGSRNKRSSSAFSGKSTLPLSSTISSGLGSEVSDEGTDTINVVVRVRPLNALETNSRSTNVIEFPGDGGVWMDITSILQSKRKLDSSSSRKSFTYNVTFEPEANQSDIMNHSGMSKLVEMAMNGYSCTAFAFGQTGSGKTYTITGPPELFSSTKSTPRESHSELEGLIPRSFKYLFTLMNDNANTTGYRITASYLEIYNEQVIDLLNPSRRALLQVRWSKHRGFYVENLFAVECETLDDLMAVLEEVEWWNGLLTY